MRFTKKTVWTAIATSLVLGLVVVLGVGVGIVKFWPAARTWTQNALGSNDLATARRVVAQVGTQLGDDRIVQLSRAGEHIVGLAALAGRPGMAEVLKLTAAMPALGPLVQNGAYRQALEEALRQNVANIAQIKLDQVASPEVRAQLSEVQRVVAGKPHGVEAATAVNEDVLALLKSEAFARLRQSPGFSRLLSGAAPANEAE